MSNLFLYIRDLRVCLIIFMQLAVINIASDMMIPNTNKIKIKIKIALKSLVCMGEWCYVLSHS